MSRQNSFEISSLEVTVENNQVNIDPIGNGTKPFDDVKVLLVKGVDGTGAESLAPAFSATTSYAVGALCTYNALLWKCTTAHQGAWDASDFTEVSGTDVFMIKGKDRVTAGQKSGETLGNAATADGYSVVASGAYSNASGHDTLASGSSSSSEGYKTQATGRYSHAEGNFSRAIGDSSHAEGSCAYANHNYSHAEGLWTQTGRTYQHVQGYYNVGKSDTAFEIGNGTAQTRSNAFEVDFSGNTKTYGTITDGSGNVLSQKLNTTAITQLIKKVEVANWSATQTAGYYTYTLALSTNLLTSPTPNISGSGANSTTPPTEAQMKAYDCIVQPNGYVEHYSADTLKLYAKEKPESDFYILVEGIAS